MAKSGDDGTAPLARTPSIAYLTFTTDDGREIGAVRILLHSDLVPLGTQNFVALLHRSVGGYRGTSIRLLPDTDGNVAVAGDIVETGHVVEEAAAGINTEPRFRRPKNQHIFPDDDRGLISLVDGRKGEGYGEDEVYSGACKFYVMFGASPQLNADNLVFGLVDQFDQTSSEAFDSLELELRNGSEVRISQCGLSSFTFKDILDISRFRDVPNDIDWSAIRWLLELAASHKFYSSLARWNIGNSASSGFNGRRTILHGVVTHEAPPDVIESALMLVSENDLVTTDPVFDDDDESYYPLTVALERGLDSASIQLLFSKFASCPSTIANEAYRNALAKVTIPKLSVDNLRTLLAKVNCDENIVLECLERILSGWVRMRADGALAWSSEDYYGGEFDLFAEHIIEQRSIDDLSSIFEKTRLLLYAIEFGAVDEFGSDRERSFSPLVTLLSLGIPNGKTIGDIWNTKIPMDKTSGDENEITYSVLCLVEFLSENFPSYLALADAKGRVPVHASVLAFFEHYECSLADSYRGGLNDGEKILKCIMEKAPEAVLYRDENGCTILHALLLFIDDLDMDMPLTRIDLVLRICPTLVSMCNRKGLLPIQAAMQPTKETLDGRIAWQQRTLSGMMLLAQEQQLQMGVDLNVSGSLLMEQWVECFLTQLSENLDERDVGDIIEQIGRYLQLGVQDAAVGPLLCGGIRGAAKLCRQLSDWVEDETIEDVLTALRDLTTVPVLYVSNDAQHANCSILKTTIAVAFCIDEGAEGDPRYLFDGIVFQKFLKALLELRPEIVGIMYQNELPIFCLLRHAIPWHKHCINHQYQKISRYKKQLLDGEYLFYNRFDEDEKSCLGDIAAVEKSAVEFVSAFLSLYPEGLHRCDKAGKSLFYAALEYGSDVDGIAKFLLKKCPDLVAIAFQGKPPIHFAIENGCDIIRDIIATSSATLLQRDATTGLYPFQTAAVHSSLDNIYHLLRGEPNLVVLSD